MAELSITPEDNNNNNDVNTTSNNRGKYNKKQLMAMSKEDRANIVFQDMQKAIDMENNPEFNIDLQQNKLLEQARNARTYMALPTNKQYHLEIIKRTFTKESPYTNAQDLELAFAEYFKLCYKHKKMPTLEGLTLFAGVTVHGFKYHSNDPQSIFHDACIKAKSLIHEITQQAAIEGYIHPNMYSLLAKNYWGFVTNTDSNVVVINNNSDSSAKQKEELLEALELSQRELDE